jgi:hypothetical protein
MVNEFAVGTRSIWKSINTASTGTGFIKIGSNPI